MEPERESIDVEDDTGDEGEEFTDSEQRIAVTAAEALKMLDDIHFFLSGKGLNRILWPALSWLPVTLKQFKFNTRNNKKSLIFFYL